MPHRATMTTTFGVMVGACVTLWVAPHAHAQSIHQIAVNAFVSTAYQYNLNRPESGVDSYRVFDYNDNSFNLDVAELVVQMAAAKPNDLGFRVDLAGGKTIPRISKPQDRYNTQYDVQQAFASYIAPIGTGLRLDVGKYVTHLGYELIEGYDGYNDNYSRSILFGFAIPFTHTGAKASYTFNSKVAGMVEVVKGWDLVHDNNTAKSVGAQLSLTPVSPVSVFLNWIGGPEIANDNHSTRNVFDVVTIFKATSALTLGANGDYGIEKGTSRVDPGSDAKWKGVAGYATYALTGKLSLSLRGETFRDEGGTRLGTDSKATLSEATLTPAYKFSDHVVLRAEVRHDKANQPILVRRTGLSEQQTTAGFNFIILY
ncbi:MAG TPA: porin [Gemmatimonadaceae bacterium]|nr:porin [Gemmatimonadaceae bacterium]